jgi:hypothetical protein
LGRSPSIYASTVTTLLGQSMQLTILERELCEAATNNVVIQCVAHFLRQHIQGHARVQDQVRARELARIVLVHRVLLHN